MMAAATRPPATGSGMLKSRKKRILRTNCRPKSSTMQAISKV